MLFAGESEEARKNLEIALRGYKHHSGPENILLDKANVLHFLGEAYRNRYSRFRHNTVIRHRQGHPMDLFLKISVLQVIFCLLGDLGKLICPWMESVAGK